MKLFATTFFAVAAATSSVQVQGHELIARQAQETPTFADKFFLDNLNITQDPLNPRRFVFSASTGRNGLNADRVQIFFQAKPFSPSDPLEDVCSTSGSGGHTITGNVVTEQRPGLASIGLNRIGFERDLENNLSELTFELNDRILDTIAFAQSNPSDQVGMIRFCPVYALAQNNGNRYNFKQMAVQMDVVLDGSFTVSDVQVKRPEILTDVEQEISFGVEADTCGDDALYRPGEPIRVCVCSANPFTEIVDFAFLSLDDTVFVQDSESTDELVEDITGCLGGSAGPQACCDMHILPRRAQFPALAGATQTLDMTGTVVMGFEGGRRLVSTSFELPEGRSLEKKNEDWEQMEDNKMEDFGTEVILLNSAAAPVSVGLVSIGLAAMMFLLV